MKANWLIYAMLLPAIASLIIFSYMPMPGVIMAFQQYSPRGGIFGSTWVGLRNFHFLFSLPEFWRVLNNTIIISLGRLLFEFPAAIILALLINEVRAKRFRRVVQTIYTFPHFLSWVIVAGILTNVLRLDGLLNHVLVSIGLFDEPYGFLARSDTFRFVLFSTNIWKQAGWSAIIYIAAIAGIDSEMFEAATIDGANRLQIMFFITLPAIMGTIMILFILAISGILNAGFDQIFNMQNPIIKDVSNIIDTYVYQITFERSPNYGFSAAVGLFKSVIGVFLLLMANFLSVKLTGSGLYMKK